MIGANAPYRFDSKADANHIVKALTNAGHSVKWEFKRGSLHRTGINSMFNHNGEWWLVGVLGLVIARVPATFHYKQDGANITPVLEHA